MAKVDPDESGRSVQATLIQMIASSAIIVTVLVAGSVVALSEILIGGNPPIWESIASATIATATALFSGYAWRRARTVELQTIVLRDRHLIHRETMERDHDEQSLVFKRIEEAEFEVATLANAIRELANTVAQRQTESERQSRLDVAEQRPTSPRRGGAGFISSQAPFGKIPFYEHPTVGETQSSSSMMIPMENAFVSAQLSSRNYIERILSSPSNLDWVTTRHITSHHTSPRIRIQALMFLRMILSGKSLEDALESFAKPAMLFQGIEVEEFGTTRSEW